MTEDARARAKRYRQKSRARLRALGICVACGVNDVRTGEPRTGKALARAIEAALATGRATCRPCGVKSNQHRAAKAKGAGREPP